MLNHLEMENIIEKVTGMLFLANRTGKLNDLLRKLGLTEFLKESVYETQKDGKIVVIGQSEVNVNKLQGVIKSLGLDKERFEFCLEYDAAKTYNYKKLQYSPKYRVVLFGPVPHSSTGKNESGSVIAEMTSKEGYPRVVLLNYNNELKITKSGFKKALEMLLSEEYI